MIRILFIVFLFLVSCSKGSFFGELITQSKSPTNQKIREFEEPKVTSSIIKALLNDPKTQRSVQSIYLARLETDSVETDGKTKFNASGSAGVLDEYETEARELAFGTIRADRLIDDNSRVSDSVKLAKIKTEIQISTLDLELNKSLGEILKAYNQLILARETSKILIHYLEKYEAQEILLDKAVSIGAISNSENLELKGLVVEARTKLANSELISKKSDNILKSKLNKLYKRSINELGSKIEQPYQWNLTSPRNTNLLIIDLKMKTIDMQIALEKKRLRPTNKLSVSATSPQSKSRNLTLFAGLTVDFPIKDGGKSETQVKLLEKQKLILDLEKKDLKRNILLMEDQWISFDKVQKKQRKLLEDRLKISKQRLKELEVLQRQGRVNFTSYVKEILVVANTEIDIINVNASYFEEILKRTEMTSSTCKLLKLCTELENYVNNFKL